MDSEIFRIHFTFVHTCLKKVNFHEVFENIYFVFTQEKKLKNIKRNKHEFLRNILSTHEKIFQMET